MVETIEALLLSLSNATDLLGVPILREKMKDIWEEQRRHVAYTWNLQGVSLYTVTNHIEKGGKRLPVLHCARGSTSLECQHLLLTSRRTFLLVSLVGMVTEHKQLLTRLKPSSQYCRRAARHGFYVAIATRIEPSPILTVNAWHDATVVCLL